MPLRGRYLLLDVSGKGISDAIATVAMYELSW
jgi:hypothetical protein